MWQEERHAADAGEFCSPPVEKRPFLDATPRRTYNSNAGVIEMAFAGDPRNEDR